MLTSLNVVGLGDVLLRPELAADLPARCVINAALHGHVL